VAEAFFWGALASSALLIGALVSYLFAPGRRVIATVMALGSGLLIGSVSFELVDEALENQDVGGSASSSWSALSSSRSRTG
jgi:ZIP family zinc transporter